VKQRTAAIALVTALLALLAAGCGEKDEPPTTGPVVAGTTGSTTSPTMTNETTNGQQATDEELIQATVASFLARADAPGACTKLVTPQFVKRSYGDVNGCEAARKPSAMAKAVAIEPIDVDMGTMVTAKPKGGVFDGESLKITLINLDGQWTIDKISSNAKVGP